MVRPVVGMADSGYMLLTHAIGCATATADGGAVTLVNGHFTAHGDRRDDVHAAGGTGSENGTVVFLGAFHTCRR